MIIKRFEIFVRKPPAHIKSCSSLCCMLHYNFKFGGHLLQFIFYIFYYTILFYMLPAMTSALWVIRLVLLLQTVAVQKFITKPIFPQWSQKPGLFVKMADLEVQREETVSAVLVERSKLSSKSASECSRVLLSGLKCCNVLKSATDSFSVLQS